VAESPVVLWFGRADRPWSQAALRRLLPLAQVRLVPKPPRASAGLAGLPEVADLLVLEEHRPGQFDEGTLQVLLRRYPLAGLVVLQGPWSAASYGRSEPGVPGVLAVPWHSWPWFVRQWQRPQPASPGEGFLGPLVPLLGTCQPQVVPMGSASLPGSCLSSAGGRSWCMGDCWVLTGDAELGRFVAEELQALGVPVRRFPPGSPRQIQDFSGGGTPGIVFWEPGSWFPRHPQREIEQVARLLHPRRIVVLGGPAWPQLPGRLGAFPAEVVLLPLPVPAGALTQLVASENDQAA